jgi:hypothetical protein
MSKTDSMTTRKRGSRGLGKGLEQLLTDTPNLTAPEPAAESLSVGGNPTKPAHTTAETLQSERLQLLQEAEALRILMLEFELIARADLR